MLQDDNTLMGLGDGGAHVSIISDASFLTFLLSYWGRDHGAGALDLGWFVKWQTHGNAAFIGLNDRGLLKPGMKRHQRHRHRQSRHRPPYMAADLPAGGNKLLQKARATVRRS